MAKVRDQHVGVLQGKLGPQVFKLLRGNHFAARLPRLSSKEPKQYVLNQRLRFGLTARFSEAVHQVPGLNEIWDLATPNSMSPFNGIFKHNYKNVIPTDVLDSASIVPLTDGFGVTTTDVTIDGETVTVAIDPIGTITRIDTNIEKFIRLGYVIKCTDKNDDNYDNIMFISGFSSNVVLNLANPLSFSSIIYDSDRDIYSKYDTHLTYLALITLDADDNPIHFSKGFTT